jgi:hypothetical protein
MLYQYAFRDEALSTWLKKFCTFSNNSDVEEQYVKTMYSVCDQYAFLYSPYEDGDV